MENTARNYIRKNFTEEGKIQTSEVREGRSRADTYYARGKTLATKAEQLYESTGAHVKVVVLPNWKFGKIREYQSPGFPATEILEVDGDVMENKPTVSGIVSIPPEIPNIPETQPLPLQEIQTQAINRRDSDQCAICMIVYNSEADFESHWIQCSKCCGYWVHASCVGIWYPSTAEGLKALKKWTNNRFYCPKHIKQRK